MRENWREHTTKINIIKRSKWKNNSNNINSQLRYIGCRKILAQPWHLKQNTIAKKSGRTKKNNEKNRE